MSYKNTRGRDPYWRTPAYSEHCHRCGAFIHAGDRAWYYPSTRKIYCASDTCGGQEARDFEAAVADERMMSGGY